MTASATDTPRNGRGNPMKLTDDELRELHSAAYDVAYYGDDEIVYTSRGDSLRAAVRKLEDEEKRRGLQ
jgi:hypothetical protein